MDQKFIDDYLDGVTDDYNGLTWKILPNNSASPTLIILTNADRPYSANGCPKKLSPPENVCLKVWLKNTINTDVIKALEYEKKVYSNIIHPIIENDEKAPFLRYVGDDNDCSTVSTLADFLEIKTPIEKKILLLGFFVLHILDENDMTVSDLSFEMTYDKKAFKTFLKEYTETSATFLNIMENISKMQIGAILLPKVKFTTMANILDEYDDRIPNFFKTVTKGLYTLYKNKVVHNDLHSDNIMIDVDSNVFIYDWDRSYSPRLGDNEYLSNDPYEDLCTRSQCNIFFKDGRPADLLKILRYVEDDDIFYKILNETLKIKNRDMIIRDIGGIDKYSLIKKDLFHFNYFFESPFNVMLSSWPGMPSVLIEGKDERFERVVKFLGGSWPSIYARAFPDEKEASLPIIQRRGHELLEIKKLRLVLSSSNNSIDSVRNYALSGTNLPEENKEDGNRPRSTFNFTKTVKPLSGIDVQPSMNKNEILNKVQPINKNMSRLLKLLSIPNEKLTYKQYNDIQDLVEEIAYGPVIEVETAPLKRVSNDQLRFRDIGEIIIENETKNF